MLTLVLMPSFWEKRGSHCVQKGFSDRMFKLNVKLPPESPSKNENTYTSMFQFSHQLHRFSSNVNKTLQWGITIQPTSSTNFRKPGGKIHT